MELLAPVKNYENGVLAINLQADAIFCSGPAYSARAKAGISFDDLEKLIKYAHLYDKKVYITLNTIIENQQIASLLTYLKRLVILEVDAILVQDLGLLYLINKYFPSLEVHASTQMHIHNLYAALFAKNLHIKRVVLARELSYQEAKTIKDVTDLEVETFIHGALCTSYSGQCFYSWFENTGSGNRGTCQQHCRNAYSLDNKKEEYLLSFKDLAGLDNINLLKGISDSLKIEGRLKNNDYLYAAIKYYRQLIDANKSDEKYLDLMKISFNREFTKGYLFNEKIAAISNSKRINNTGLLVGNVVSSSKKEIVIELDKPLYRLDVVRIVNGDEEYGVKIDWLKQAGEKKEFVNEGRASVNNSSNKVISGAVYIVKSERLNDELKYYNQEYINKITKEVILNVKVKEKMKAYVDDREIMSDFILDSALKQPLTQSDIIKQLTKTNDTPYEFKLSFGEFEEGFINRAQLNDFRRKIISALLSENKENKSFDHIKDDLKLKDAPFVSYKIIIKTKEQAQALSDYNVSEVYVSDLDLLSFVKDKFKEVVPVLNRVNYYEDFEKINEQVSDYDRVMVSELGMLEYFKDTKVIETNFSLNVTNKYSLQLLKEMNVALAITSLETKSFSIEGIASGKIVYGRLPVMISKSDLIANEQDYLFDYKKNKLNIIKHDNGTNELFSSKPINLIDTNVNGYAFVNFTFENYDECCEILKKIDM